MIPLSGDATRVWAAITTGATARETVVAQIGLSPSRLSACLEELAAGGWLWSETEPYRPVASSHREYARRRRARTVLARAVAQGEIQPAAKCAQCRTPAVDAKLYGLQPDPQRPLRVEAWLCAACYQVAQRSPTIRRRLPRRRGRPGVGESSVNVSVKLPAPVYDAYCRRAITAGVSVHALLRRTLTLHACAPNRTGPIPASPRSE